MRIQLFLRTVFLFLVLSSGINNLFGQTASFRNFSVDDGLAQSQIYVVLQDHKGYLWLGTRGGGLSRFDGRTFYTYSEQQGLSSNYISSLYQDEKKQIWIGTSNGLCVYNGSVFRKIQTEDKRNSIAINAIAETKDKKILCATNNGLYELVDGKLKQRTFPKLDKNMPVYAVYCSASALFIGTGEGLYEYSFKIKSTIYHGARSKVMKNAITRIEKDKNGRLLIGTYGDGMYCYDWKMFYRIDLHLELYKETVFDFHCEKNKIWIATLTQGLVEYNCNTKKFTKYTQADGLANNHVRSILKDRCGDLWLGTSGGGLSQLSKKLFSHYTTTSGLGGNFVYSVYRDSKGQLWMGTGQNGVSIMQRGSVRQLNKNNGFDAVKVKAIAEDDGKMYFGTEGQGIGILHNGKFHWMKGTSRFYIKQMVRDKEGIIWVASVGNGLLRIDPKAPEEQMEQIMTRQGCIDTRLTTVHIDAHGLIWYGSETKGVGCYNPLTKKHVWINEEKGLISNSIRTITSDSRGNIWVGTAGFGIVAIDGNTYKIRKTITIKSGLYSSNVYCMIFDGPHNLLVGTEAGLNLLVLDNNLKVKRTVNYSRGEGFLGVETCQNSCWKDADGKIWIGTVNGVTAYNSKNKQVNNVPPVLNLVDIQLSYESLRKTKYGDHVRPWNRFENLNLPYDENHLSFIFKGINLRNPEAVEYSWKMEAFDDNWSPWTKDQRITYSNLPSGTFSFLVRARNEDGVSSKEPLRFNITISTPYWRTGWFYVLLIVTGVVVLVFAFRFQSRRIKEKARKAQEQAELEKNLVELEQKALRLQMNPHFIFNALNSIQGLIGTEHETKARYYLAKFSRLMRQILDNSRKTTITLEEEMATLENYLLVEQFCTGNRFEYEITSQLMTEANYVEIPPMLVQPFVENAIKHGFRFSPEEMRMGKITVHFQEEPTGIRCIITDNGIGRKASGEMKTFDESPKHESKGLTVTEERLQLLGDGQRVEITDLYNEKNEPCGTQINLFIPF